MTKILIPRSDNSSAKIIEASDWEKYFADVLPNYFITGFAVTATAGCNRSVDIATGAARLLGLYVSNTTVDTAGYTFGTDDTHYLYITIDRDPGLEPEAWVYSSNTTGITPVDSIYLATVVTAGGDVSSVDQTTQSFDTPGSYIFGSGADGEETINCTTTLTTTKFYTNLTVNANLTTNFQPGVIYVKRLLTINCGGIIEVNGDGANGGAGGSAGGGAGGAPISGNGAAIGTAGSPAPAGGVAGSVGTAGGGGGGGGGGGAVVTGGTSSNGGAGVPTHGAPGGTGGTGGPHTTPAAGGGASGGGSLHTVYSHVITFLGASPPIAPAWGGGGSGGAGAKGGGGGGGGARGNGSPNAIPSTGGAGGGGGSSSGGSGGKGGGTLVIFAKKIIINAGGGIQSRGLVGNVAANGAGGAGSPSFPTPPGNIGGAGGAGGAAGGGAGGGGGGGGGVIMLVYSSITNSGTIDLTGGAGGAGVSGGAPGNNPGNTGSTGLLVTHIV